MTVIQTQNHIHLHTEITYDVEKAPSYRWSVVERIEIPVVFMAVKRAVNGKLRIHSLQKDAEPWNIKNFQYVVKCAASGTMSANDYKDLLMSYMAKTVYLVDNLHSADGTDHSSFVRRMGMAQVGEAAKFDQVLSRYYISVFLEDDSI